MSNPEEPKLESEAARADKAQDRPVDPASQASAEQGQLSLGNLVPHDSHAFDTLHELEPSAPQNLPTTDLSLSPQLVANPDSQVLPGAGIDRTVGTGLTAELSKELSSQASSIQGTEGKLSAPPTEFKWSGQRELNQSSNLGLTFPLGNRQFFQARKSEFLPKIDEKPLAPLKSTIDKFLIDTKHNEDKRLTPAEKQDIEKSREAIENAATSNEALSHSLHLARLYQHLQYIDEAKKAVELSLGIDPDNVMGKQLFKELERTHPHDLGATAEPYAVTQAAITKSQMRKRILALSGGQVIVAGDLLIDELLEGKPERISREAPVLILEHVDTELIPGGAANTAHNIASLGGYCHAIGVLGDDEYAVKLIRLLESCDISHALVTDASRPTTVKTRILSKSHSLMQQLLRLDRVSRDPVSEEIEAALVASIRDCARNFKAIVLSDYRAGVITDGIIRACRELSLADDIMLIVDAQGDFSRFHDVTLMTPNQPDTEKFVGFEIDSMEALQKAGAQILRQTGATALLITRGAEGMALFQKGEPNLVQLPVFNRSEVFDVTGAGDTVVGTMALALVTGANFVEAMALGNLAAGIVVRKSGTAVTTQEEMLENLDQLSIPD